MHFENDDKLKSYLKKESVRLGISITNIYNTYFSMNLLKRINKLGHDKLCVKGSFSELAHLYTCIYETNDELFYEFTDVPKKTKTGIYKMHITANFGKIKHPISIDFQELSKTIYEKDYKRINPIFKNEDFFYVFTPSYEEHFAEKLCIVTESNKSDILNTRVKDFYDIYKLSGGKFDRERLSYFFYNMLKDRNKIDIDTASVSHLDSNFINRHIELWSSIGKKYEFVDKSVDFESAVTLTKNLIESEINNLDKSKKLQIRFR